MTKYLQALVAARQGRSSIASGFLKEALNLDPSLAAYANNDLELLNVSK
jgi:hypothetical protein